MNFLLILITLKGGLSLIRDLLISYLIYLFKSIIYLIIPDLSFIISISFDLSNPFQFRFNKLIAELINSLNIVYHILFIKDVDLLSS